MNILSNLATIALAILALLAGWISCIRAVPDQNNIFFKWIYVGPILSRVKPVGWFFGVTIIIATSVTIITSDLADKRDEKRIELLQRTTNAIEFATEQLINSSENQSDSLEQSIQRLKTNADALADLVDRDQQDKFSSTLVKHIGVCILLEDVPYKDDRFKRILNADGEEIIKFVLFSRVGTIMSFEVNDDSWRKPNMVAKVDLSINSDELVSSQDKGYINLLEEWGKGEMDQMFGSLLAKSENAQSIKNPYAICATYNAGPARSPSQSGLTFEGTNTVWPLNNFGALKQYQLVGVDWSGSHDISDVVGVVVNFNGTHILSKTVYELIDSNSPTIFDSLEELSE